jgi:hypothetical protein
VSDTAVTNDRLVRAYLKMRQARSELKREFEGKDNEIKAQMEVIEGHLLKFLNDNNLNTVGVGEGSFYRQVDIKPSAASWPDVYKFAKDNDAFDIFEKRLTKKFVVDYMDTHDNVPPPGVNVFREYKVVIRTK